MKQITGWGDVTLKVYSEYNKIVFDYQEKVKDLNPEIENEASIILLEELKFQHDVCATFSGLTKKTIDNKSISEIKDYCKKLDFLKKSPEDSGLKEFEFKGVKYSLPENLRLETKYGQYVEAMQSEIAWKAQDKTSLMYLAHQLAHQVKGEWVQDERDKLAIEFESLTMDVFWDFSFFLQKKSAIYTVALQKYLVEQTLKNRNMKEKLWGGWATLKQYIVLLRKGYLKDLIKLRLIVFYILTRERFLITWDTLRQKVITNT